MKYNDVVDLSVLEPVKRDILEKLKATFTHCETAGVQLHQGSVGEPAVLFDLPDGDYYLAFKMDGVGTKSAIADKMAIAEKQGQKLYSGLGQDLVAMNVNDLVCVGAIPFALANEIAMGDASYLTTQRREELLEGLVTAAQKGMVTIACGETAVLPDIIAAGHANITGAALGLVPRGWLRLGEHIQEGDCIYGLSSSGIHSNGLSLARRIAENLPVAYATPFAGKTLGEELLIPTHIYCHEVLGLFEHGIDVHYISNITGSGWRKVMRSRYEWTYVIDTVPPMQPIFSFLQEKGNVTDEEAYQTWNMGVGMIIIASESEQRKIAGIAQVIGHVEKGPKRVILPFTEYR